MCCVQCGVVCTPDYLRINQIMPHAMLKWIPMIVMMVITTNLTMMMMRVLPIVPNGTHIVKDEAALKRVPVEGGAHWKRFCFDIMFHNRHHQDDFLDHYHDQNDHLHHHRHQYREAHNFYHHHRCNIWLHLFYILWYVLISWKPIYPRGHRQVGWGVGV